jgi:hypothetical protein
MAGLKEFNSFVGKRKLMNLWHSGVNARLHVKSEAGKAFISLHVGLGHAQPVRQHQQHPSVHLNPPAFVRDLQKLVQLNKLIITPRCEEA